MSSTPDEPHDHPTDADSLEPNRDSGNDTSSVDPEAPGAALVDPTAEQVEPNEPA